MDPQEGITTNFKVFFSFMFNESGLMDPQEGITTFLLLQNFYLMASYVRIDGPAGGDYDLYNNSIYSTFIFWSGLMAPQEGITTPYQFL